MPSPTPDQDERIAALWYSDGGFLPSEHVAERAGEIVGGRVERYQLTHRYGPRDGSRRRKINLD